VIRQRIVTFERDPAENAVRMKQYFIRNEADVRGAHRSPEKLSTVGMGNTYLLPGCDVFWTRDGNVFTGAMKDRACVFALKPDEPKRTVIYRVSMSAAQYLRVDRSVFVDTGKVSGGRADDLPTVHKRVGRKR
jgi:hypothetical protein